MVPTTNVHNEPASHRLPADLTVDFDLGTGANQAVDRDSRLIDNILDGVYKILFTGPPKHGSQMYHKIRHNISEDRRLFGSWHDVFLDLLDDKTLDIPYKPHYPYSAKYFHLICRAVGHEVWCKHWRNGKFPFLKLPLEVRRQVYGYLLPDEEIPIDAACQIMRGVIKPYTKFWHIMPLVLINRQISEEVQEELYGRRTFNMIVVPEGRVMKSTLRTQHLLFGPHLLRHCGFIRVRKWRITVDIGPGLNQDVIRSKLISRACLIDLATEEAIIGLYKQVIRLKEFFATMEKPLLVLQIFVDNRRLLCPTPSKRCREQSLQRACTGHQITSISNLHLILGPLTTLKDTVRIEASIENADQWESPAAIEEVKHMLEVKDYSMAIQAQRQMQRLISTVMDEPKNKRPRLDCWEHPDFSGFWTDDDDKRWFGGVDVTNLKSGICVVVGTRGLSSPTECVLLEERKPNPSENDYGKDDSSEND